MKPAEDRRRSSPTSTPRDRGGRALRLAPTPTHATHACRQQSRPAAACQSACGEVAGQDTASGLTGLPVNPLAADRGEGEPKLPGPDFGATVRRLADSHGGVERSAYVTSVERSTRMSNGWLTSTRPVK